MNKILKKLLAPSPLKGWLVFGAALAITFGLGILVTSVLQHRQESLAPLKLVSPVADQEPDSAKWGKNFPQEYQTWLKTALGGERTRYGGPEPFSY
jgi:nitrite reductase (cytochrome c-552)